jgi:hypothetical protein
MGNPTTVTSPIQNENVRRCRVIKNRRLAGAEGGTLPYFPAGFGGWAFSALMRASKASTWA